MDPTLLAWALAHLAGNATEAFEASGGAGQWEFGDTPGDT
jgi:hypothetical protein